MSGPRGARSADGLRQRRRRFRHEEREDDRHGRDRGGGQPDRVVRGRGEDRLGDRRPDRDAEVQRQRQEADRLAATLLRGDVGGGRERSDEEEALAGAEEAARQREHEQVRCHDVQEQPGDRHDRPADQQRPPPEPVGRPADDRPQEQRGDAERADRDPEPERVGAELQLREPRRDRQHEPARDEERERRRREGDERRT